MPDLVADRDSAVREVARAFEADPKFVAAWLAGSFGRGEQDEFSDLDLWLVVAEDHAAEICHPQGPGGGGTTSRRRDIISLPGEPLIVHEHHLNAPAGGTFTAVIYRSGLSIDWTFIPQSIAARNEQTVLLFERVPIPITVRSTNIQDLERVSRLEERYMFLWLLAIPAAKALRRKDGVKFHALLEMMYAALSDIKRLLDGNWPGDYTRHSLAPFCPTVYAQRQALEEVSEIALELAERVRATGAAIPESPGGALDSWLEG